MAGEFDPTEHPNVYRKALEKLLAAKRRFALEEEPEEEGNKPRGPKVVDLMATLKRSLDAGKGGRARKRRAA